METILTPGAGWLLLAMILRDWQKGTLW